MCTDIQPYGAWTVAWGGLAALAVGNGLARGLYVDRLGETRAHRVSTATLVPAILGYARAVDRLSPLPSFTSAMRVGLTWVGMTVAFEFGFGRYVARQSWATLLADYDLRRGRLWPLVLVAAGTAPTLAVVRRLSVPTTRRRGKGKRTG